MDVLHNIHSDLKRFGNVNLSNPRGSDTNMLTEGAKKVGELAAHAAVLKVAPVIGNIALQQAKNASLRGARLPKLTQRVLNPNPLQYPPALP